MRSGELITGVAGVPRAVTVAPAAWLRAGTTVGGLVLATVAYGVAQPSTGWWGAAWLVPGLVLLSTAHLKPRAAFAAGTAFGMLAAYATVAWAIDAALVYFAASRWAATAFLLLVWATLVGPWYGAVVVAYHALTRRLPAWAHPLAAGWVWALGEWVRCALGLPWCLLAYTQVPQPALIQVAAFGGAGAVTAVMALVSVGALQWVFRGAEARSRPGAVIAAVVAAATWLYGHTQLAVDGVGDQAAVRRVAIVQPNIANRFAWQRSAMVQALTHYSDLTLTALRDHPVDLVVWPENAVGFYLDRDGLMRLPLADVTAQAGGRLLVGAPRLDADGSARNAAYLLDGNGAVQGHYDKRHLLPLAEYRPWPFSTAGDGPAFAPGTSLGLFPIGADVLGVLICWDANFPALAAALVQGGAGWLVHLSNDAWLDGPSHGGPLQHLAAVTFRAVETRRWIVRAASTGVSGFISPTGELVDSMAMAAAGVRTRALPVRSDRSLYVRFGDAWLGVGAIVLALVAWRRVPGAVR